MLPDNILYLGKEAEGQEVNGQIHSLVQSRDKGKRLNNRSSMFSRRH